MPFSLSDFLLVPMVIIGLLLIVAYTVLAERKVAAAIQRRIGPNRVGVFGLLQPFADLVKLLFKEDFAPKHANSFFHILAPLISMVAVFSISVVIPFSPGLVIADLSIGLLYIFALTSIAVYGITLSGWASGSTFSMLGGLRSSAQMISYEIPMGLSIVSIVIVSGSLNLNEIVQNQTSNPLFWNIFKNFFGFIVFVIAVFAETNRAPFDLPEAEQELVGGFHTEYTSMRFGLFMLSEYASVVVSSAVIVTLFLGGYQVPFLDLNADMSGWVLTLLQLGSFFIKTFLMIFVFIWVRWTVPRFKYNQLMDLGWRKLIPISLLNLILVSIIDKVF